MRPVRLDAILADDIRAAKAEMPRAFGRPWPARAAFGLGLAAAVVGLVALHVVYGLTPERLLSPDPRAWLLFVHFFDWSGFLTWEHRDILRSLGDTVAMAFIGTTLASLIALPLAFLAARNVLPAFVVRFMTRRTFDVARGVDQVIWALMFISVVGLGPLAGILAIIVSDSGTLGKLFSEAIENTERGPVEGVRSVGASPVAVQRYGLLPEVLPVFVSQALYFFESNTRSATVLGLVGAGGIGFELIARWQVMRFDEVAYVIVLILITVSLIDTISGAIRRRLIGGRQEADAAAQAA
ncbi:phosphonate ABC transporter, permease protein PhnE [Prosthecomicrobium pneumaticum]|uniref:Phosphonate transport system permease protein n=1 Tax=Prosthecomicrobium pneumaticum TaxID=81895 RepID=A0A7W9L1T9_9HYPH|nr:phosphonate ABC transporter, permease protein PhnE [Prosthecomicrobium pneumaticum]MBB5752948.1 phosphonate transport system permease protein [Prosthecomicrobium pneumaticum]